MALACQRLSQMLIYRSLIEPCTGSATTAFYLEWHFKIVISRGEGIEDIAYLYMLLMFMFGITLKVGDFSTLNGLSGVLNHALGFEYTHI